MVTGGAGFIGSNFIRYWLSKYSVDKIVNLDILTYAANPANLQDIVASYGERYSFVKADIGDTQKVVEIIETNSIDLVINFAAESHNSRAVIEPGIFVKTNVLGTQGLLEACRKTDTRIHHVSTCEVYGDMALDSQDSFVEACPYRPNTPYNASKAAADHLVRSYYKTFGLKTTISICSNNYGPYQFPEKIIPLFVSNAIDEKLLPIYKSSENKREWLHVLDHCNAIDLIVRKGIIGESYNVGSGIEKSVEEITDSILHYLDKPLSLKSYVADRPGHDRRYLLNSEKIRKELAWQPEVEFEQGLEETIQWYMDNESWWRPIKERLAIKEDSW